MSSAEGQSVELQLCLDGEGRTVSAEHKPDGTSNAIDYSSKAVMSELSSPIDITERREIMDDLLFDAEIADCGLLPRTFWMPCEGRKAQCRLEKMALEVFRHHVPVECNYDAATSGAISESQVTFALAQLPKLHARWWNQALLRGKDYFVQYDDPAFFALGFGAAAQIAEQLGTWFDAPDFTQELMPMVAKKLSALQALYANRPFTLVHGDYHAKQLFFPSAAGGRFAVIDWQFPFIAQGAWDFARLLTLGLATVDRRANERNLLNQYHQGLVDGGVEDYTLDDLTLDFQLGLIISHMINIIAIGSTDEQLIKEECDALGVDWKDVMFYRGQNALKDWQVLELISEL